MPEQPFPITEKDPAKALQQMMRLLQELFEERIGGANIGDVFTIEADDILTISLGNAGGLEKSASSIVVKIKSTGGLQTNADGISIKTKATGGLITTVDGAGIKLDGSSLTLSAAGLKLTGDNIKFTTLGGLAIKLTNETGVVTVAGQLVRADTGTDDAVILTAGDDDECFGVFLDAGVADGAEAWVVVSGIADVAMEDNTTATKGNWVRTSVTEAGYADATNATPPAAGAIIRLDQHMREIGHCIETVAATGGGTHISARCVLHLN